MKRAHLNLLLAAFTLIAPIGALAAYTGTIKTYDAKSNSGEFLADGSSKTNAFRAGSGVDKSQLKPGVRVEYTYSNIGGGMDPRFAFTDVTKILTPTTTPIPINPPAPPAASAAPRATVKSFDAATHQGTLAPVGGGRDLFFAVDPKVKADIKVGAKVTYVEVMITGIEP